MELRGNRGIPRILENGKLEHIRYFIMELLGESLEELMVLRMKPFSEKTVY